MPEILTLTMNPALDIATTTEIIEPSRKLRCEAPRYDPGGGGINVARAAHMLGGDALAVFPAGGASGQMIEALLGDEGVPNVAVPVPGITRESLAVVERTKWQAVSLFAARARTWRARSGAVARHARGADDGNDQVRGRQRQPTARCAADFYRRVACIAQDRGAALRAR